MKLVINAELDTAKLEDNAWLMAFNYASRTVIESKIQCMKQEDEEADEEEPETPEPTPAPEPEPEKPKRKRNKKEPAPEPEAPTAEPETSTETGELPFDEEITPAVEPTPEPAPAPQGPATATEQDWRNALAAKKAELGIETGTDKYRSFLDWIHKASEFFGHRAPSHLEPEALAKFLEQFKTLTYSETEGFQIKAPY
jgi:outer membrane biosynthesis protein TonB